MEEEQDTRRLSWYTGRIALLAGVLTCITAACSGEREAETRNFSVLAVATSEAMTAASGTETDPATLGEGEKRASATTLALGIEEFNVTASAVAEQVCLPTANLASITNNYYLTSPTVPDSLIDPQSPQLQEKLASLHRQIEQHLRSGASILATSSAMQPSTNRGQGGADARVEGRTPSEDAQQLLQELENGGYCNSGVTRQLSISKLAKAYAAALAHSYDGIPTAPGRFGEPALYYGFRTAADPLYVFMNELDFALTSIVQSRPEARLFLWPAIVSLQYCYEAQSLGSEKLLEAILDELVTGSENEAISADTWELGLSESGLSREEFDELLWQCIEELPLAQISIPYDVDSVAALLYVQLERWIRLWLLEPSVVVPAELEIVD